MDRFEFLIIKKYLFSSERPFSKLIVSVSIAGIALGVAVMLSAVAITNGFKNTIGDKVRGFSGDYQISKFNVNESYENEPFHWDNRLTAQINKQRGVSAVNPFATKAGIISANGEMEGVILKGVPPNFNWNYFRDKMTSQNLDSLRKRDLNGHLVISKTIADRLKVKAGDAVMMYFIQQPLRKRKLVVSAVFDIGLEELDKTFVLGDINLIRRLNDWQQGDVGGVQVTMQRFDEKYPFRQILNKILPLQLKIFSIHQLFPSLFEWLSLTDTNVQIILILMVLVSGINMISALLILILERTSAIGTLKALGAANLSIRKIFLGIAAYLIGVGILAGNAIGLGFCFIQRFTHFLKLSQETYYMAYVPIQLPWIAVFLINGGTLLTCVFMLVVPSMMVSNVSPIKSIRFK